MFDILCVTNRKLCREDFLCRIEKIAKAGPRGIILREKDLSEEAYKQLAVSVCEICKKYGVLCILHSFAAVAEELGADGIHMPLPLLRNMTEQERGRFRLLGASCHSVEEAREAQRCGCTYVTAGHIFKTDCKRGLPGRGTGFLREVCESVTIPIYGIGGIGCGNYREVLQTGAKGACIMSGLMCCEDVESYMEEFRDEV